MSTPPPTENEKPVVKYFGAPGRRFVLSFPAGFGLARAQEIARIAACGGEVDRPRKTRDSRIETEGKGATEQTIRTALKNAGLTPVRGVWDDM